MIAGSLNKYVKTWRRFVVSSVIAGLYGTSMIASVNAAQGPGLGNLNYGSSEAFTHVSSPLVDDTTNFLPPDYPGRKHYGVNVMTMLNGYMVGVFAPDSGGGPGGWIALDVSNPKSMQLVKTVYEPDLANENRTGDGLRTAEFREPHSFGLGENNTIAIQSGKGIEIWDWSDVSSPVRLSKLAISGVNFGDYNNVSWQLFWQAPYLYVARGNAGITIVDTTDMNNPTLVKTIPNSELGGFNVGPIFALGNRMFISSMEGTAGFSILNIDDPINPTLAKTVNRLPEKYYASCWDGRYAYFGARSTNEMLRVYDTTTNPMTLVNEKLTGFENLYCNVQDNKLFLGNQDDIAILDVSDINNIRELGRGSLNATSSNTDHGQVFPFGNLVWVGNDHGSGSGLIAHQSSPDMIPPYLSAAVPDINSTLQPLTTRVGIALSDSVLMDTVHSSSFTVTKFGSSTPLEGEYSTNLGFINFTPSQPLEADSIYEVTLEGIQDFAGNPMARTEYRFSTGSQVGHDVQISSVDKITLGSSVNFAASTTPILGGDVEYSWNFGDGGGSTPFSPSGSASYLYGEPNHWSAVVTVREATVDGVFESSKSVPITVYRQPTFNSPTASSTIIESNGQVLVVNEDNDSVSAIANTAPYAKQWETAVGDQPRTLAVAPDGNIWVVNQASSNVSILSSTGQSLETVALPRAAEPYGIAFTPDGTSAFVSLQSSGQLVKIDPTSKAIIDTLDVGHNARGIAIDSSSSQVLVTRFISPQSYAEVVAVDVSSMTIDQRYQIAKDTTTIDGPDRSRGIANYLGSVAISPDGYSAWLPSNKANVDRGSYLEGDEAKKLTFETTVRAIVNRLDLNSQTVMANALDIDDRAQPKSAVFSDIGDLIFIAVEGQNSIEIRNTYTLNRTGEIFDTGLAPRGLVLSGNTLFVHNFMSRTVSVHDLTSFLENRGEITDLAKVSTVENESFHPRVLKGKQIFYNAADARMTQDGYISCASCHADGDSDHRVWDFTDRGEGLRNTISLLGKTGTGHGRVHWTASFDEIQDFENDIRYAFGGRGFMVDALFTLTESPLGTSKSGKSEDLDNLAFYVSSLNEFPQSPYRDDNGNLTSEAQSGETLFAAKGCNSCHEGVYFTDMERHDVGTIDATSGQGIGAPLAGVGFDTPSLIGLWNSAPYFHNGQASTLDEVLQIGAQHTVSDSSERAALVAYLQQIEYEGPTIVVPDPPQATTYVYLSDVSETSSTNGWGPIEKDTSVGENAAGDGSTISIGGSKFDKGLGVHAHSEVTYSLTGDNYNQFTAFIGVDDEVGSNGSVVFEVWIDDVMAYQSSVLRGSDVAEYIAVNISSSAQELKLVVSDAGDGVGSDHASWGDAKLRIPSEGGSAAVPGLFYGTVSGNINVTDENPKMWITTSLSETEDSIAGNTTEVYTGYIYDADGQISFSENNDDKTRLWIDGQLVLSSDLWSDRVSTGNLNLAPGWHQFELRLSNGNGGSGPHTGLAFAYDPDGGTNWIHPSDNGTGNLFMTEDPGSAPVEPTLVYLSDIQEDTSTNGWGPIEKDMSNGEEAASDGVTISIGGQQFAKGLGVHANSSITYTIIAGEYSQFTASIGVDDEVGNSGSVQFQVELDSVLYYQSVTLTGSDAAQPISIDIPADTTSITLKVNDTGNGNGYDHASWGNAALQ
ncbi:NPCBM/NEW2 domain-containing protein [Vibrio sp. ZSDE26]|uniref:NPCBM/NEW2 domain-containing protein n=1 Tax=Vibrio amylolyticus TaxID=2847292 RepID=A0A9X1XLZ2_9VIBR|nr:NPCBM/NEW2 domain-containing protein [Vibrio amylolyticus]MCK6264911.1 NPCBM/NEW2 domain-containing protein [Vibrio amylolyticus]